MSNLFWENVVIVGGQIVRINQVKKDLIVNKGTDAISHHAHSCAHSLAMGKVRIGIFERRHVGNSDKKSKESSVEESET